MHSVAYKALNLEELARKSAVTHVALGLGLSQEDCGFFWGGVCTCTHASVCSCMNMNMWVMQEMQSHLTPWTAQMSSSNNDTLFFLKGHSCGIRKFPG